MKNFSRIFQIMSYDQYGYDYVVEIISPRGLDLKFCRSKKSAFATYHSLFKVNSYLKKSDQAFSICLFDLKNLVKLR